MCRYNGPYNIAGTPIGAHEGDWEHMTVRCTTDGRLIAGTPPPTHRYAGSNMFLIICAPIAPGAPVIGMSVKFIPSRR